MSFWYDIISINFKILINKKDSYLSDCYRDFFKDNIMTEATRRPAICVSYVYVGEK
jgi:hypothetical protein